MPNWTPMTLRIDGPVSEELAEKLVTAMIQDGMDVPEHLVHEEDLVEALMGDQGCDEIEWKHAGTSSFSVQAQALLEEAGLPFTYTEMECFEGDGTRWTYDPKKKEYTSEDIEGYEWESDREDDEDEDKVELAAPS